MAPPTYTDELAPGMYVRGHVHACACCGRFFIARKDALYCSNACRVAASRKR